ncbi:MAG: hypothetical protein IH944_12855 [Armatimonadetes bacterium]|nr:hypothetical protein [Armatimonadota bacterium]
MFGLIFAACLSASWYDDNPITVDAGFYVLNDLCKTITETGVSVRADESCAKDVYAVSLSDVEWGDLRKALEADGRLEILETAEGWSIRRSQESLQKEAEALDWYLETLGRSIAATYGRAMEICERWGEIGRDGLSAFVLSKMSGGNLASNEFLAFDILYRTVVSKDTLFWLMSLPSTASNGAFLGSTTSFSHYSLWDRPDLFVVSGNMRDFRLLGPLGDLSPTELEAMARAVTLARMIQWDPISNDMGLRSILEVNVGGRTFGGGNKPWAVSPRWVRVEFPRRRPQSLLDSANLSGDQVSENSGAEQLPAWTNGVLAVQTESVSLSELLLQGTKNNGGDLLAYLPRIGDFVLAGNRDWSVQLATKAVNSGQLDEDWIRSVREERSGVRPVARMQALSLRQEVALTTVGGVVVASYGRRFMDSLVGFPASLRIALANSSLSGDISSADVFEAVSDIDWKKIEGSLYPMELLRFCNPCSLYPFALAYKNSSQFRKLIDEAALGEVTILAISDLDSVLQDSIWEGMRACADRSMFIYSHSRLEVVDPLGAVNLIDRGERSSKIRIKKTAQGVTIELVTKYQLLWQTWLKGTID